MHLKEVLTKYDWLIPGKMDGLILLHLHNKIRNKEIEEEFTQLDIQRAADEVRRHLHEDTQIYASKLIRRLLYYFLDRPLPNPDHKYFLTDYAKRFIRLIDHKVNSPHRSFPLKDSFVRYFALQASEIDELPKLESWFENGFTATSRQMLADHLEALQDEVEKSIRSLRGLQESKDMEIIERVKQFSEVFKVLGDKAQQITDTLAAKKDTIDELKKIYDFFSARTTDFKHAATEEEKAAFAQLEREAERARDIRHEVRNFFRGVDARLERIRSKIAFASARLVDLQENFEYQSYFKINLRRMLEYTLQNSLYDREYGVKLPEGFPKKQYFSERAVFLQVPDLNFQVTAQAIPVEHESDSDYLQREIDKVELEMRRQESSLKWVETFKQHLREQQELDFEQSFFEILETENDIEIPLRVGFELMLFANHHPDYEISVKKELSTHPRFEDIALWKMKVIHKKAGLSS